MANFSVLFFLFIPVVALSQTSKLISFDMEDQFHTRYTPDDFLGKMIVLIGSDRGGSEYNNKWGKAIEDELKRGEITYDLNWLPVADVSAAPFFMKGYVRNMMPEDKKKWVLLDWDGDFADAYHFKEDMSNILIFDAAGKLVFQGSGTVVNKDDIADIVEVIKNNY